MSDDDEPAGSRRSHDEPAGGRGRWRDDPLSVFLAVAAVLLAIMYFLEQRDVETLEAASAEAQALGAKLALDGCVAGSASTDGEVLVFACDGAAKDAATRAAAKEPELGAFRSVLFVGSDAQLACGVDARQWPEGCVERPLAAVEGR